jgi:hypothetical protein
MIDENGQDLNWTPEPRKLVTAVLQHPIHGRLVENIMLMIYHCICFKGCAYTLSWRDGDVAFYRPALVEAMGPTCCG